VYVFVEQTAKQRAFWIEMYFLYIGLLTFALGLVTVRKDRAWTISDWLINYEGGFVRRGLAGQTFYLLSRLFHTSPIPFVLMTYFTAYALLLVIFRRLVLQSTRELWVIATLLSPATLAFPILDMSAGFRKEIVFLAILAAFVAASLCDRFSAWAFAVYLTGAAPILVLVHESLICFAPYFFAALLLAGKSVQQALRICILPFVLAMVAAFFSATHIGGIETASKICASIGYPLELNGRGQICSGGSIAYSTHTRAFAREKMGEFIRETSCFTVYSLTALLALAPVVIGSRRIARAGFARQTKILWVTAAISFACSLVLFAFAIDWGRWIYIHVLSIAMLLLSLDNRRHEGFPASSRTSPTGHNNIRLIVAALVLAAYATLWTLPHSLPFIGKPIPHGYISLFQNLHQRFPDTNSK
jgi:hypothetical protein